MSTDQYFETVQDLAGDIAREFREDASRWTQGELARDANGEPIDEDDPIYPAVCWCLRGAIDKRLDRYRASSGWIYLAFDRALGHKFTIQDHDHLEFVPWNDQPGRTVEEVIALCEKVAAS